MEEAVSYKVKVIKLSKFSVREGPGTTRVVPTLFLDCVFYFDNKTRRVNTKRILPSLHSIKRDITEESKKGDVGYVVLPKWYASLLELPIGRCSYDSDGT